MCRHRYCNSIIVRVAGVAAMAAMAGMMADTAGTIMGAAGAVAMAGKVMVMAPGLAEAAFVAIAEDRRLGL
jgi:hypothetical protein